MPASVKQGGKVVLKLRNDRAVVEIRIGTREFKCIGASPPHDHPHIYIDMGSNDAVLCPYCATRYRLDAGLALFEAVPADSLFVEPETDRAAVASMPG